MAGPWAVVPFAGAALFAVCSYNKQLSASVHLALLPLAGIATKRHVAIDQNVLIEGACLVQVPLYLQQVTAAADLNREYSLTHTIIS